MTGTVLAWSYSVGLESTRIGSLRRVSVAHSYTPPVPSPGVTYRRDFHTFCKYAAFAISSKIIMIAFVWHKVSTDHRNVPVQVSVPSRTDPDAPGRTDPDGTGRTEISPGRTYVRDSNAGEFIVIIILFLPVLQTARAFYINRISRFAVQIDPFHTRTIYYFALLMVSLEYSRVHSYR